ncbi:histone PARylation factor 1 [Bicyclus anynana]|uniref:Histone PARylation factor 1 n=1 Tax=Bicyclus anynana TaxID=110368 RepID=A0A6J1N2M0_BICAN|nr:histone PARylation factor 1 [Bicyclus anynana]
MSEEWKAYTSDTRVVCKYGTKCYQKNPEHHKQYKHPPQLRDKVNKRQNNRFKPYDKEKRPTVKAQTSADDIAAVDINVNDVDQPTTTTNQIDDNSSENSHQPITNIEEVPKYLVKSDSVTFHDKDTDPGILKECFLTEMPDDFFQFYKCLQEDTENVEKLLSSVNLQLIGPYELFLGKLPKLDDKDLYLIHWRFFFDPPEFQAVLKKKGKSEFHIGYYRDDPQEKPVFLAKNDSSANYTITPVAENIFGAVYSFLQNEKKTSPFISISCQKLMEKVKKWADTHNFSIEEYNINKKRIPQIVCRTFHSAGIVVPYNKKTQLGYRKLAESDADIKKMFKQLKEAKSQADKDKILSELQPVITYASIAMDECDFGTGLEAGIALFCSGLPELQKSALKNLEVAYSLLGRGAFSKIIQMHMKYRRKGPEMSVLGND